MLGFVFCGDSQDTWFIGLAIVPEELVPRGNVYAIIK
jgi:hypothetical protein